MSRDADPLDEDDPPETLDDGDIAEIIAVHGALSAAELTQLETYLETKYGLP